MCAGPLKLQLNRFHSLSPTTYLIGNCPAKLQEQLVVAICSVCLPPVCWLFARAPRAETEPSSRNPTARLSLSHVLNTSHCNRRHSLATHAHFTNFHTRPHHSAWRSPPSQTHCPRRLSTSYKNASRILTTSNVHIKEKCTGTQRIQQKNCITHLLLPAFGADISFVPVECCRLCVYNSAHCVNSCAPLHACCFIACSGSTS